LSTNIRPILFIVVSAILFTFGCATKPPKIVTAPKPAPETVAPPKPAPAPQPPAPAPEKKEPEKTMEPVTPPKLIAEPKSTVPAPIQTEKQAPRTTASLRLTEQGRLLIESKKPDEAISILEKAVNIDTNNSQNYYLLAEAWFMKGNQKQAREFNRIAGTYLKDDAGWALKVQQQKERIDKASGIK
jgi:tetratricopeptide (TPR) repeat protein